MPIVNERKREGLCKSLCKRDRVGSVEDTQHATFTESGIGQPDLVAIAAIELANCLCNGMVENELAVDPRQLSVEIDRLCA